MKNHYYHQNVNHEIECEIPSIMKLWKNSLFSIIKKRDEKYSIERNLSMKRTIILIILLILLQACSPKGSSFDSDDQFIYSEVYQDGQATGTLIVANMKGEALKQITLPAAEDKQIISLNPSRAEGIVLVSRIQWDGLTNDMDMYWINALTGEINPLDFQGYQYYPTTRFKTYKHRFEILEHIAGMADLRYQLVDLETGETTDLSSINESFTGMLAGEFSPNESNLLLHGKSSIWLVPTDAPQDFQQISNTYIFSAYFSSTGEEVFFTVKEGDEFSIYIYSITEQNSLLAITYPERVSVLGVLPDQNDLIFVSKKESLSLLNISNGEEQELLPARVTNVVVSSSGKKVLAHDFLGRNSYLINLDTLEIDQPSWLEDLRMISSMDLEISDWIIFVKDDPQNLITQVKALHIETGSVQDLIESEPGLDNLLLQRLPTEGTSSMLLSGLAEHRMVAWGINYEKGLVVQLDGGDDPFSNAFSLGGISTSGDYGIYSVIKREELPIPMVMIMNMNTGEIIPITTGRTPVWLVK